MSRNSEYQFVSTDAADIVAGMVSDYEAATGSVVLPASPEKLFIQWVASVIVQGRALINYTGNQNLPSRADGESLDELGLLFYGQGRPAAQPAVCTQRFHLSAAQGTSVLVPAGTRVTDANGVLTWETTADAYVPIGELSVDVPTRCQSAGVLGNGYAPGQVSTLVDVGNISCYERCENITESDMGADRATDEEYYRLLRESLDAYSTAGARGAYVFHAMKVSTEVIDVVANSPRPAEVVLYVLMRGGCIAGGEVKQAVLVACNREDVRPLTDLVSVEDPEEVSYDIEFEYFVPSRSNRSSAEVESAVEGAVDDYIAWQCGKLGRDINPDELRQRVMAAGAKRLVLTEPAFSVLRDGMDDTVPQIAMLGTVTVVNGGYEDE